ncbi:hypothetical protein B0H10DRAFT_383082 [Mycena sp. CBHHK59/15]|nr:hypothetical protein B0H10DRAFT_383082 [Mycena sp. CBHHK59/15]
MADGWLRLAIELAVPEPEKQPSSPPTSQPSSPPTSQPSSRPTSPMPTKDALYYQVDEANIPGGVLGSPIHLVSPRTSPTPAASPPYTSTLATLFGPTNSIQLCDVDLVARFSEPQLPSLPYGLFNQGQTQTVVTPSRRSKNASPIRPRLASSTVHTPPPATLDNIPRGVLIGGYMPIVPAVDGRTTKRWPRVWYPPNGVRPKS